MNVLKCATAGRPRTGVSGRKRAVRQALRRWIDEPATGDGVHEVDVHFQVGLDGRVGFGVDVERRADFEDAAKVQARHPNRKQGDISRGKLALEIQHQYRGHFRAARNRRGRTIRSALRLRVPSREASNPTTRLRAVLGDLRAEVTPEKVTA